MRLLRKNMQPMKYSLQDGRVPIYERDENGDIVYIEVDGQKIPVETGEYETGYSAPVDFMGNISMSGGEAEAKEFGMDIGDFDAVIVLEKDAVPLTETSIIWHTSPVKYKDEQNTIVDSKSADYAVKRVSPSLNFTKVLLQRIVK
mgnify:FL=1